MDEFGRRTKRRRNKAQNEDDEKTEMNNAQNKSSNERTNERTSGTKVKIEWRIYMHVEIQQLKETEFHILSSQFTSQTLCMRSVECMHRANTGHKPSGVAKRRACEFFSPLHNTI